MSTATVSPTTTQQPTVERQSNELESLAEALKWFKTPAQMESGGIEFLVDGFLPEGTTFLGGPSGHGKTWVALTLARALYRGTPFLGYFAVPKPRPIIYLVPEASEKQFRQRLDTIQLGDVSDGFYVRTLTDGITRLYDPSLLRVVRELFLDTVARFNEAEDENSASQNVRGLSERIFALRREGAIAIIPLHHSPKDLADPKTPVTLEKTLRGSGELGAIADGVYCIRTTDKRHFRAEITCVKDRDFEGPEPFEIQGRPYINDTGDFKLVRPPAMDEEELENKEMSAVIEAIRLTPNRSLRELGKELRIDKMRVKRLANKGGWSKKDGLWQFGKSLLPVTPIQ